MSFELLLILYFQIFTVFFTYNYTKKQIVSIFLVNKVVVNKSKDVLKKHLEIVEKDIKLSPIWPVLVLLWIYDKIAK